MGRRAPALNSYWIVKVARGCAGGCTTVGQGSDVDSKVYCELLSGKVSLAAGQLGRSLKVTYWSVEGMTCSCLVAEERAACVRGTY